MYLADPVTKVGNKPRNHLVVGNSLASERRRPAQLLARWRPDHVTGHPSRLGDVVPSRDK